MYINNENYLFHGDRPQQTVKLPESIATLISCHIPIITQ